MASPSLRWKFQWHYFGDIATLLTTKGKRGRNDLTALLIKMWKNNQQDDVLKILKDKRSTNPRLYHCIKGLDAIATRCPKGLCAWQDWQDSHRLELFIQKVSNKSGRSISKELILTPKTLYIPWRFPGKRGHALYKRVKHKFKPKKWTGYNREKHLLVNPCFRTLDHIIDSKHYEQPIRRMCRAALSGAKNDPEEVRSILIDYHSVVFGKKLYLPNAKHLVITIKEKKPSDTTYVKCHSDSDLMEIVFGLEEVVSEKMRKYPNGCFKSFDDKSNK